MLTGVYRRLFQIFRNADERYNSGLFHFENEKTRHESPDDLTPSLDIDDKTLKEIIRRLYYPESPYEFSVLPADILGQVYEQFLGKVIRLTAGHRAIVEEKPEVRKAGGVYYTPTYIVDYIVKNTVGKLLNPDGYDAPVIPAKAGIQSETLDPRLHEDDKPIKTMTPKEVSKIRILDPACGSGSFLLGAYQFLLDWHRDWYVNNVPQKWAAGKNPVVYQAQGGDWHLTTAEKKRILLNNIYGVDIDSQAVEVTKLSLLLKVLEGENNQTLERQLRFFHERALPDLGDNIKCGNSLIGPDFYEGLFVGADPCVCPPRRICLDSGTNKPGAHVGAPLHRIIQWFKTMTTNEYITGVKEHDWSPFAGRLWQRNYYERVVRNEGELMKIREYISQNPTRWADDEENPGRR
ncbi:MAG: hypothetical protein M0Z67_00450 [Nitrospiraceae bacterium]|nr:hypothetical protein [Nitrospiraceae bacterium]